MGEPIAPLPRPFSLKTPDPNFEIFILFTIVERSKKCSSGDNLTPRNLRKGL